MSISSIAPSAPPAVPYPNPNATKAPEVTNDGDANNTAATQPPAPAPLPPGQGTRVNQLV
jgi:hypothetical protein